VGDHGHGHDGPGHDAHGGVLNIAIISGSMPPMPCGVGDNALALGRALAAKGHRITIYTHISADALSEGNLTINPLVSNWNWSGCHALAQQLLMDGPDITQIEYPTRAYGSNTGPTNLPLFLKLRKFRGPIVIRLHEWEKAHWLRRLAIWPMLNDSNGIMVPSADMREDILFKHRSLKDRPVHVIPVGPAVQPDDRPAADADAWGMQLKSWGVPDNAHPLILSFGFVRKDKGLESLAAAIAAVKKNSQAHVVHIGPFTPATDVQQEAVLDAIAQHQVADRFHFVGEHPLSVLPTAVPRGTVAIFPYTEGISNRRSAAITLGTLGFPIITTHAHEPEVDAAWSGLAQLIPAGDDAALTAAIQQISGDTVLQGHPEGFATYFGWDRLSSEVEAFYEDVYEHYRILIDPGCYPASMAELAAHAGGHH